MGCCASSSCSVATCTNIIKCRSIGIGTDANTHTSQSINSDNECSICLIDIESNNENNMCENGHIHHDKCIDEWINQKILKNEVPDCPKCYGKLTSYHFDKKKKTKFAVKCMVDKVGNILREIEFMKLQAGQIAENLNRIAYILDESIYMRYTQILDTHVNIIHKYETIENICKKIIDNYSSIDVPMIVMDYSSDNNDLYRFVDNITTEYRHINTSYYNIEKEMCKIKQNNQIPICKILKDIDDIDNKLYNIMQVMSEKFNTTR